MTRSALRRLLIVAALGAGAVVTAAPPSTLASASTVATRYAAGIPGLAFAAREPAANPGPGLITAGKGVRSARPAGARDSVLASAPVAAPGPLTTATLRHNFNGVGSLDSQKTNFGLKFEPPDQGLCVGHNRVLEAVNSAYSVYRPDGTAVAGPFNVNDLFDEGSLQFTSDPRCYFDPTTNTWFALILFINSASTASHFDLAVNSSGDPTTPWKVYRFDTTDNGTNGGPRHPGCPCFGDQPLLGIDQYNVYVSTNEFSIRGPRFNGAQIYAISKADLVRSKPAVHFEHFSHLTIGGVQASSVQPALSTGAPQAEYFMSSLDPNGTFDHRLGVWAMTNRAAVSRGGSAVLSSRVIKSEEYGRPPAAHQQGSTSVLDAGDDRMQQVQYIGDSLWGELTTSVTIAGDPSRRAGAAWFRVNPWLSGAEIGGAVVAHQGYVAKAGNYVIYPALQADAAGAAVMVYTLTGGGLYPSAAYSVLSAGSATFGEPVVASRGAGPYDHKATRWGDYSWAVRAPGTAAVWLATEYVPPVSSQTTTGQRNWGTRVMEVSLG